MISFVYHRARLMHALQLSRVSSSLTHCYLVVKRVEQSVLCKPNVYFPIIDKYKINQY